jgi:hypothetical protein
MLYKKKREMIRLFFKEEPTYILPLSIFSQMPKEFNPKNWANQDQKYLIKEKMIKADSEPVSKVSSIIPNHTYTGFIRPM